MGSYTLRASLGAVLLAVLTALAVASCSHSPSGSRLHRLWPASSAQQHFDRP